MRRSHLLLALLVVVIWGINFVAVALGLEHVPPLLFAALRFTFVALPAVFLVRRPGVGVRTVVLVGTFLMAGQFGLLFVAMDRGLPAGLASLVLQVQAPFTVLFALAVLRERPTRLQLAGLAVAAGGLVVIGAGRQASVPLLALLLAIAAGASWGVGNIVTRIARPRDGLSLIVWASLVPPVPLALLSLVVDGPAADRAALASVVRPAAAWPAIASLAYVVVLATLVGYAIWTTLLREYPASRIAPFTLLVPPVGIGAAWLVLGERPGAAELAGAAVVLAGIALLNLPRRRRAADPVIPVPATGTVVR